VALIRITENSIGSGVRFTVLPGDDLIVAASALVRSDNSQALRLNGSDQTVTVRGTVQSDTSDAIYLSDTASATGQTAIIEDGGILIASSEGVSVGSARSTVRNAGTIIADYGIYYDTPGGGTARVFNSGTIIAAQVAIYQQSERMVIENSGRILNAGGAAIDFVSQNDVLRNSGLIDGEVSFSGGNDLYVGLGGRVTELVQMGGGTDRVVPGAKAERFDGDVGTDTIDFGAYRRGVDVALDNSFADTGPAAGDVYLGFEIIRGSAQGDDRLRSGLSSSITLDGKGGNDTIDGGQATDTIIGGAGRDVLAGLASLDLFQYARPSDGGDRIKDFAGDVFRFDGDTFDLPDGALAAARFISRVNGNRALDGNDRFVFRLSDETLWFDKDGVGGKGPVLIANLQDGAVVDAGDIFIS
jgi:Ca2+-binding RTX toxin-like protein